jgi:hypothetical protein
MSSVEPESIRDLVEESEASEATLLVLNRTEPDPVLSLLSRAFERQPVHVVEREVSGPVTDEVVLLTDEGAVASSPLEDLASAFLLINADRFRTGANYLTEESVPAVLRELTDIAFELRGYPASAKEKLLLIVMSRYIEAAALRADEGTLRVGFGRLARLDDEYGTREVYRRLGESGVETHIYGVGGEETSYPDRVHVHEGTSEEYRRSWFVTFEPAVDEEAAVALFAWETGENVWRGTWTFDAAKTREVADYVRRAL